MGDMEFVYAELYTFSNIATKFNPSNHAHCTPGFRINKITHL